MTKPATEPAEITHLDPKKFDRGSAETGFAGEEGLVGSKTRLTQGAQNAVQITNRREIHCYVPFSRAQIDPYARIEPISEMLSDLIEVSLTSTCLGLSCGGDTTHAY